MVIASAPGANAWTSPRCPFLAKKAVIVEHFLVVNNLSSTSMQKKMYIGFSTEVIFSTMLLRTSERLEILFDW